MFTMISRCPLKILFCGREGGVCWVNEGAETQRAMRGMAFYVGVQLKMPAPDLVRFRVVAVWGHGERKREKRLENITAFNSAASCPGVEFVIVVQKNQSH